MQLDESLRAESEATDAQFSKSEAKDADAIDFDNLDAYDQQLEQEIASYEAQIQAKKNNLKLASSQKPQDNSMQDSAPEQNEDISVSQYFADGAFEPDEGILRQTDKILMAIMAKYSANPHTGINLVTLHEVLHGKVSRARQDIPDSANG